MPRLKAAPARIPIPQAVAACTAFAAFAVSLLAGVHAGNPMDTILSRALIAMASGFAGGFAVGLVCDWMVGQRLAVIDRELARFESANVDDEGLTGVDIVDEGDEGLAPASIQSETRRAGGRASEKNAA
jgi:hypothetical protein